jgi:hypothetical protein
MRNLIVLISLILLTSESFCQTITRTELQSDSVVVIPKTLALWILKDLEIKDMCIQENETLSSEVEILREVVSIHDRQIDSYKVKVATLTMMSRDCDMTLQESISQINLKDKEIVKSKRSASAWKIASLIMGSIIIIKSIN